MKIDSLFQKIPTGWQVEKCNNCCKNITVGIVIRPSSYYVPKGIIAIRNTNIKENYLDLSNIVYISEKDNESTVKKSKLKTGDIVVARTGTPGTASVIPEELDGINCIDALIVKQDKKKLLSDYLCYFLNSFISKKQVSLMQTGMAQQHLNVKAIKKLFVIYPPLLEQQKIVSILENVDNLIQTTKQLIQKLQILKRGLIQKLITNNGVNFEQIPFRLLIKKHSGKISYLNQKNYAENGDFPIVDQGKKFVTAYSGESDKVYSGELPIIIFGDHTRIFKYIDFRFICGAQGTKVLLPDKSKINPLYFYYVLLSLKIKSRGYSRHYSILKEMIIPVPEKEKQLRITQILKNIDNQANNEINYYNKFKEIKKGLMQVLLTGKKRVKV